MQKQDIKGSIQQRILKKLLNIFMAYIKRTVDLFKSTDFRHAMKIEIRPLFFNFATESF